MNRCTYACGSREHGLSRRSFLGGLTVGSLGLTGLTLPSLAKELQKKQKHVLMIDLHGGVSQLETWDPKPGTNTGGPFQTIATSVPGIHICELLPHTATQMHRLSLVRSINTQENDHGKGHYIMYTGRRKEPAMEYPHLGSVAARLFAQDASGLPGYISITPEKGGGFNKQDAAFLGPRFGSVALGDGQPPANLLRPGDVSPENDKQRNDLRAKMNDRFLKGRKTADTEAYTGSFDQAEQLMAKKDVFDVSREPMSLRDRYGSHDFGRHLLLSRRLIEAGATFVKVAHSNYDTHHENFDFHIEQLGEFDRPFATLIEDLAQRGLLEHTLIMVISEFGRTPTINRNYGRDHWGTAWSIAVGGCGIVPGAAIGKTNANGTAVSDRMVNGGHLFHTYLKALGFDSKKNHYVNQRPIPMADPKAEPIKELLA